jgi:hypothetical protein
MPPDAGAVREAALIRVIRALKRRRLGWTEVGVPTPGRYS